MIGPDDDPNDWIEVLDDSFCSDDAEVLDPAEDLPDDAPVEEMPGDSPPGEMVSVRVIEPMQDLIRRGKRLLAAPHGTLHGPAGDPSPRELFAMCRAIQAGWTGADTRRARCRQVEPVEVREVRVLDG